MKKFYSVLIALIITVNVFAQAPEKISYQAVVRNSSNQLVTNHDIGMRISILQTAETGAEVYVETQTPKTNANGLVTVEIGSGTIVSGVFSTINWSSGIYFIRTEIDPMGGTSYTITGTSQLLSVPYALHAKKADTYSETDPVFTQHPANGLTNSDITNWNAAYSWGNHASAGYLTNFTETDPIFLASAANSVTATNLSNWNTAYSWGNHASAGYLTNFTETDPIFLASAANSVTATNLSNWNTAYSWGNHASAGYLTNFTETDPIFLASAANSVTATNLSNWNTAYSWGNHASAGYLKNFTETDPTFLTSAANGITLANITDWNNAFSWGNHVGLYRPISYVPTWSEITSNPFNIASPADNQLLRYNSPSNKWENWTPNFLTTEVDGSVTNEIQTLALTTNQLSISGTGGNSVTFTNWDTDKNDDVTLAAPVAGDILYYNGSAWTAIPKGTTGQVLTMGASGTPGWQNAIQIPPAITNAATFNIATTPVTAILNGSANPNNLSTVVTFEYGLTTSYGGVVTADQSPISGGSTVNITASLASLTAGNTYHFRIKTQNALGVSYGEDMTFTLLGLGLNWAGGIIFYLDGTGLHGLVAATTDQSTGAEWGCSGTAINGADGTIIGTGNQNTIDIENGCTTASTAADLCANLIDATYDDWFLPSSAELQLMYTNLKAKSKGSFSAVNYWSSSERDATNSWKINFGTNILGYSTKDNPYYVRAARAF